MLMNQIKLDALQCAMMVLNQQARIVHMNTAARVLLRTHHGQSQNLPLTQWFEIDETLNQILLNIQQANEAHDSVCRGMLKMIRQADGSELESPQLVYVALSMLPYDAIPVIDERADGPVFILECFELGAYEQAQQDSQWRAQAHSHQLLMRQLAHEIKNPLGGIRGATQLLQDELESVQPELVEYTEMILEQVDRLKLLVDQYLVPYRQGMAQAQTLNIHEVCEKVFKLAQVEFAHEPLAQAIVWLRDYDVSIPLVRGVPDYLQQLLLNLLQNAAQAVMRARYDEGSVPKITLRTRIARNCLVNQVTQSMMLEVSIIDNGAGVPEEIQDTLFLPMVTQREGGTGLGLSVAMQIAQQHGGTIELQSRASRTQMRVLLPLQDRFASISKLRNKE